MDDASCASWPCVALTALCDASSASSSSSSSTPLLVALVRENEQLLCANARLRHALALREEQTVSTAAASDKDDTATPRTSRARVADAAVATPKLSPLPPSASSSSATARMCVHDSKSSSVVDAAVQCDDDGAVVCNDHSEDVVRELRAACCVQQRMRGVLERCRSYRDAGGADARDKLRGALDDVTVALRHYSSNVTTTTAAAAAATDDNDDDDDAANIGTTTAVRDTSLSMAQEGVRDALLFAHVVLRDHVALLLLQRLRN